MNIATFASNVLGSSRVPTFTIIELGRDGLSVPIAVPHLSQKCRVTGVSRSFLENVVILPELLPNEDLGNTITIFGLPPVIYWHSLQ